MSRASDTAYHTIREMIISGALAPGDALAEEALAQICGVSRTPVRDAMRRLESELLIRRSGTQRSFVADWSLDDIQDAFELRALLEGLAAKRAAALMTDDAIAKLSAFNKRVGEAVEGLNPDVETFLENNRHFHNLILSVADSARLEKLLQTLIEQPIIWRTAHHYSTAELRRSYQEHDELIAAFKRGDAEWAETIMVGHIRRAFHTYADAHNSLAVKDREHEKRRA
ncbi:MAG: GntR family transcriptional regulator [Erythrobacter sp.]